MTREERNRKRREALILFRNLTAARVDYVSLMELDLTRLNKNGIKESGRTEKKLYKYITAASTRLWELMEELGEIPEWMTAG